MSVVKLGKRKAFKWHVPTARPFFLGNFVHEWVLNEYTNSTIRIIWTRMVILYLPPHFHIQKLFRTLRDFEKRHDTYLKSSTCLTEYNFQKRTSISTSYFSYYQISVHVIHFFSECFFSFINIYLFFFYELI